ncbi:MAG: histone deacetylase family protein [Anaerolineae bacterium]|nr:histone deacetylase family protein [Anaerolineae bacterium]
MLTVYTEQHKLHDTEGVIVEDRPLGSFEVPARAEAIVAAVREAGLGPVVEPKDHGLAPILAVHDAGYVEFLQSVYAAQAAHYDEAGPVMVWTFAGRHAMRRPGPVMWQKGYYAFGWGSPILEGTWQAAYWSAQCALTAAGRVQGGEGVAYALCRPPGHHAGPDLYGGYCYLNNAAIAARRLARDGERVAVLDVDYHHGNGTQLVFYGDPAVLYCSLHADPDEEYPYYWGAADELGTGAGRGTNRNWPLPRGTAGREYLAALGEALDMVGRFAPRYLVVSVGLDVVEDDPEGGFRLTADDVREVGRRIGQLGLPTVVVQEGGYAVRRLGENAVGFLRAIAH